MILKSKVFRTIVFIFATFVILDGLQNEATSYSNVFLSNYNCTNSPLDAGKTCAQTGCHLYSSGTTNPIALAGLITSNIPVAGYTPSTTYTITASITRPGHSHFGFSISPQNASQILGSILITDGSRTSSYGGGGYVAHNIGGVNNSNTATWSFDWTAPAAGSGTVTFFGSFLAGDMSGGTYTVTGDTTFTSTLIVSENVCNVPDQPGSINGNSTVCRNSTINYFINPVAGATSYTWTLPAGWTGSSSTNSIDVTSNSSPGTLEVYASNSCGDGTAQSLLISIDPVLNSSAVSSDVNCHGGNNGMASGLPSGGTQPFSYQWSPSGGTAIDATNLTAGVYTLTVTDQIGCTINATTTINEPPAIVVETDTTPATCGMANGTATALVSGGIGPYSYEWSPGGVTSQTVTALGSGTYTVVVTDANACTSSQTATVTQPSTLSVQANSVVTISCFGDDNGEIHLGVSGGIQPYTFSWNPAISTNADASLLAPGNYTVTVTDNSGCSYSDVYAISEPPMLTATIQVLDAACQGQSTGGLVAIPDGGVVPYSYSWSTTPIQISDTASGLAAGNYSVTITDNNNCSTTASATVQSPPAMVIQNTIHGANCEGSTVGTLASVQVSGGTPGYLYAWSNTSTTNQISNVLAGDYIVTVTDQNGCSITDSITIPEPPALIINFTASDVNCYGGNDGSILVNPTGGTPPYSYSWQSDTSQHGNTLNGIGTGNYLVIVSDVNTCFQPQVIHIDQPSELIANAGNYSFICTQGQVMLGGNPAASGGVGSYVYSWSPADSLSSVTAANPLADPSVSTTYTLMVTDGHNCSAFSTSHVDVFYPSPFEMTEGPDILWTIPGFDSYQWLLNGDTIAGATGATLPHPVDGIYTIVVQDSNGCILTSELYNFITAIKDGRISDANLIVFPNPAGSKLMVHVPTEFESGILTIKNKLGQDCLKIPICNKTQEINLTNFENGMYFIQVEKVNRLITKRFSILK